MTDDTPNVLDLQRRRHEALMTELREHRRERREQTELLTSFHRSLSTKLDTLNKRLDNLGDEVIDTIRIELGGRLAPMETRLEQRAEAIIAEQLEALSARVEALEKAR